MADEATARHQIANNFTAPSLAGSGWVWAAMRNANPAGRRGSCRS